MSKAKYLFLIILSFILFFSSCTKMKEEWIRTKVSGVVVDYNTGVPISNIEIELSGERYFIPGGGGNIFCDTICSNSDGKFEFDKFHAISNKGDYEYDYYLHIISPPPPYNPALTEFESMNHNSIKVGGVIVHIQKGKNNKIKIKLK
jgi:hypothetical protein